MKHVPGNAIPLLRYVARTPAIHCFNRKLSPSVVIVCAENFVADSSDSSIHTAIQRRMKAMPSGTYVYIPRG